MTIEEFEKKVNNFYKDIFGMRVEIHSFQLCEKHNLDSLLNNLLGALGNSQYFLHELEQKLHQQSKEKPVIKLLKGNV